MTRWGVEPDEAHGLATLRFRSHAPAARVAFLQPHQDAELVPLLSVAIDPPRLPFDVAHNVRLVRNQRAVDRLRMRECACWDGSAALLVTPPRNTHSPRCST